MVPYKEFAGFEVRECVMVFDEANALELPPDLRERMVVVCQKVWNSPDPEHMILLHQFLFQHLSDAGVLRQESLISQTGEQRNYPRSDMVPRLMVQVFRPSYKQALQGDTTAIGPTVEEALWRVGAMLRTIHPFREGNRVLSWVVENQLRNWSGLRPTIQLKPKPLFDNYRNLLFWPYANQIME